MSPSDPVTKQRPQQRPLVAMVTFGSILASRSGAASRSRRSLEDLVAVGFDAAVLSVGEAASGTIRCGERDVRVVSFPGPVRLGVGAGLVGAIRRIAGRADAVLVSSAQLLPAVRTARLNLPVIWDTTELEYLHYRRLPRTPSNQVKGAVWWMLERWSCAYADVTVAISEAEAASWRRIYPSCASRLCVVDHRPGSDPTTPGALVGDPSSEAAASPARLVFVGNLGAKQNLEAARWIARSLAPLTAGKAELVLVGPGTERLEFDPGLQATVTCLGEVDSLAPVLGTAAAALAPLMSGAGVKTKVLDTWPRGCGSSAHRWRSRGWRTVPVS